MLSSATIEALAPDNRDVQSYPLKETNLRPTHTLTASQSSTVTCTSTANLVEKREYASSQGTSGFSCCRRKRKDKDAETNKGILPMHGKEPEHGTNVLMGWKLIFFGSCECQSRCHFQMLSWLLLLLGLNILILLIPATVRNLRAIFTCSNSDDALAVDSATRNP